MSRVAWVLAFPAVVLLLTWASAPIAGQIAGLLFAGIADGLRGALWAIGVGIGVGVGISLPLATLGRLLGSGRAPTALPRPTGWWDGPTLPSGDIEGEWREL